MEKDSVKIKMFWVNDFHFVEYAPKDGEKYIPCYKDFFVKNKVEPNAIALIREPRLIQPSICDYLERHWDKFRYIFTHDSELLKLPNAKPIIWAGVWHWSDCEKDFNHPISNVVPEKAQTPLKVLRKQMAFDLQDRIDCYGTFNGGDWAKCEDYLEKYPYSIVMENYIDDLWFTEKICNCFANNTVPIYLGSKKITDYFNGDGIIQVNSREEIEMMIDYLIEHGREDYFGRLDAIKDNRERVKEYESFETWFMNRYGDMLGELL